MFLRPNHREKDGKRHTYWSLVETVRTADGPRQRTLCHLGELNDSAQARWLKTIDVFNDAGERHQLKLFPSDIAPPPDDAEVAQSLVHRVWLERTRQLGAALLAGEWWSTEDPWGDRPGYNARCHPSTSDFLSVPESAIGRKCGKRKST